MDKREVVVSKASGVFFCDVILKFKDKRSGAMIVMSLTREEAIDLGVKLRKELFGGD